jgi:hypothetical protein
VTRRLHALHPESHDAVVSILRAQRDYVVELQLTPDRCGAFADRGRFADVLAADKAIPKCGSNATTAERKARRDALKSGGARLGRQAVRDLHCGLLAEEVERRLASGFSISEVIGDKADVVKSVVSAGTVARSTAYRLIDEVISIVSLAARYQASTLSALPSEIIEQSTVTSETVDTDTVTASAAPEAQPMTTSTATAAFRDRSSHENRESNRVRLHRANLTRLRWQQAVDQHRRNPSGKLTSLEQVIEPTDLDPDDWMTEIVRMYEVRPTHSFVRR